MTVLNKPLSGFNHYPVINCDIVRAHRYQDLIEIKGPLIARGQGKSYGDAALNDQGKVLLMQRLNRFLEFDRENGIITAEAGITLSEILEIIIPSGWFLSVTPGTQYATLGGCVAADVHGKNHLLQGSFCQSIRWIELILANSEIKKCSQYENTELFLATVAGMGLTGIISAVSLQLIPIKNEFMQTKSLVAMRLSELIKNLKSELSYFSYRVAWLDPFAKGKNLGRGIVFLANHDTSSNLKESDKKRKKLKIPYFFPNGLLNKTVMEIYNEYYFKKAKNKSVENHIQLKDYFYPLDNIINWNYLYGKRGFVQYQCVVPENHAEEAISKILEKLHQTKNPAFQATLKCFTKENAAFLSFPKAGVTIALDIPLFNAGLFNVLNSLDELVLNYQGRVYLAKDARLSADNFKLMYPGFLKWSEVKSKIDPDNMLTSHLAKRLKLGEK